MKSYYKEIADSLRKDTQGGKQCMETINQLRQFNEVYMNSKCNIDIKEVESNCKLLDGPPSAKAKRRLT